MIIKLIMIYLIVMEEKEEEGEEEEEEGEEKKEEEEGEEEGEEIIEEITIIKAFNKMTINLIKVLIKKINKKLIVEHFSIQKINFNSIMNLLINLKLKNMI